MCRGGRRSSVGIRNAQSFTHWHSDELAIVVPTERGECKSTCFRVYYWNFERRRYFRVVVVEKRFTLPFIISLHLPFSEEKVHFPVLYQCRSWSRDFNCSYHVGLCKEPEDHKATNCVTSFWFEEFRLQTRYLESTIPLLNVLSCTCIPWFYSSIGTSAFKMWFNPQTHQPGLVSSPSRLYRIFFWPHYQPVHLQSYRWRVVELQSRLGGSVRILYISVEHRVWGLALDDGIGRFTDCHVLIGRCVSPKKDRSSYPPLPTQLWIF